MYSLRIRYSRNEEKNERIEEQKILNILHSEFSYNKKELQRNIDKAKRLSLNCDSLLFYFNNNRGDLTDEWTSNHLTRLTAYSSFDPSLGALSDVISSGKLQVIQNDSLRLVLAHWSGRLSDNKEDEIRIMDFGEEYVIPVILNYGNPNNKRQHTRPSLIYDDAKIENIIIRHNKAVNYLIQTNYGDLMIEINKILAKIQSEIQ